MKKPKLLAPAGDLEKLKIAIDYGADEVYFGGAMFGLRANAVNFTKDDIIEAAKYAHDRNRRIFVTVNIILHHKEIPALKEYLIELDQIGVDAIIISDPAIIKIAKENTNLELHLSTQQSTLNKEAVEFWKNEGITRIIMGREASMKDIKDIIDNVDIEVETFVHGAMCAGYSGRCVLSNFLTERDANRGGCAQVCRWEFDLLDENKNVLKGDKDFTFCVKDLCYAPVLPDLINLGITSLKIEGRMRSIYYIATIVDTYRKLIDSYLENPKNYKLDKKTKDILDNVANRDSTVQFFNGEKGIETQYYMGRTEVSNQDFLAVIIDYDENTKLATIEQRNYFEKGDKVEIFGPNQETFSITIDEIYDEDNNLIDVVRHPKQIVKIKINNKVFKNNLMRKITL